LCVSYLVIFMASPIHNLMEDAATAEISRSQLYQWIKHGVKTEDGKPVTKAWVSKLIQDQVADCEKKYGKEGRKFKEAGAYLEKSVCGGVFDDFLTVRKCL
jgi:malate synthase